MCGPAELCCRTPRRSHVLQGARFLFSSSPSLVPLTQPEKDDEITVLMQLSDDDGLFLVRFFSLQLASLSKPATGQGYCEGVVGRFTAAYVQFTGKLKTPVISKRSSSTSKSPRPRSLTPSHRQQPSQSPVPGPSRPSSPEQDRHNPSSPPSAPNLPPLAHRGSSDTSPRSD